MATEFTTPEFLDNYSVDEIYETMKSILPLDIDSSEGSHTYNFIMPTALVLAEIYEYVLPQVIQLIFPEWSYGEYLDNHAAIRGMERKAATAATGDVTVTGTANTVIPAGTLFTTASLNEDDPAISYATTEQTTIPASGSVTIEVVCSETGTIGNTIANTVILLGSSVSGITGVTNADPITGGTDEETDESLIARIEDYDKNQGDSYIGNISDYRRWAMSVAGVGNAIVIPANDQTGLVTIVITDANGDPASEDLCTTVYDYIMSPDDPAARIAPINAYLSVISPSLYTIKVSATVELTDSGTIESVEAAFLENMTAYLQEAPDDGEVKITRVAAILSATDGVNDFTDLMIGGSTGDASAISLSSDNLPLDETWQPIIYASGITFTEGTV